MRTTLLPLCLVPTLLLAAGQAQCPDYSGGPATAGIGSVLGGTYVPMIYVDCLPSINVIEAQFGKPGLTVPIDGDPLTIAIWDDPNDDMNPTDAVLVATIPIPAGVTGGHTGQWQTYDIVTLLGSAVPCTGGMFIGMAVEYPASSGHGPAAINFGTFTIDTQWFAGRYPSLGGAFDFANIGANSFLAAVQNQGFPPGNWLIRASSFTRSPYSCGTAGIHAAGTGAIGTNIVTTILNPAGFAFIGYGLTSLGIPFCNCTLAHEFSFLAGGPSNTLSIPPSTAYIGSEVLIQGLDFLAPGGCPDPTFTLTDSFSVIIH